MKIFKGLKKSASIGKQLIAGKEANLVSQSLNSSYRSNSQPSFGLFQTNDRIVLDEAYINCVDSEFQPMEVEKEVNSITITLPIKHSVYRNHGDSLLGEQALAVNLSEQQRDTSSYSYLQLKFTHEGEKCYLFLKCFTYLGVCNYDFGPLLAILHKPDTKTYPMGLGCQGVIDKAELIDVIEKIYVRRFIIHGPDDEAKILQDIQDFNQNCLRRFEELTYHRDNEAYDNSQELGRLLHKIVMNHQEITIIEYEKALNRLKVVLEDEVFQNDPQICLSLTHIVNALLTLSQKKELHNKGVEIDEYQMQLIAKELAKHEGKKPKNNLWFSIGTVEAINQELEDFFALNQTAAPIMN